MEKSNGAERSLDSSNAGKFDRKQLATVGPRTPPQQIALPLPATELQKTSASDPSADKGRTVAPAVKKPTKSILQRSISETIAKNRPERLGERMYYWRPFDHEVYDDEIPCPPAPGKRGSPLYYDYKEKAWSTEQIELIGVPNRKGALYPARLEDPNSKCLTASQMPYNTTAIVPSEEVTGAAVLPLARVKKTINADEDIGNVSAQAAFVICKATEIFVQYASEKSYDIAKADAKPKRSLTYSHVSSHVLTRAANAVARNDNLEFLSDIAPQTTTWRTHKANQAAQVANQPRRQRTSGAAIDPRQTTLGGLAAAGGVGSSTGETTTSAPNRGDLSIAMNPVEELVNGSGPVSEGSKNVDGDGDIPMV